MSDTLQEALIKSTDYSVPSAVADGHHSSDDISSTCMFMTLTRGHPLPRTVLNTHLIRGSFSLSSTLPTFNLPEMAQRMSDTLQLLVEVGLIQTKPEQMVMQSTPHPRFVARLRSG